MQCLRKHVVQHALYGVGIMYTPVIIYWVVNRHWFVWLSTTDFRQVHVFHFIRNKTMSVQIEQSPVMGGYKMIIWSAGDEMFVSSKIWKILEFCICFVNPEKYNFKNLLSGVRFVGRKSLSCIYSCEYIFHEFPSL